MVRLQPLINMLPGSTEEMQAMRVLITGTPACGKTEVAKKLGLLTGWKVIFISKVAISSQLSKVSQNNTEKEVDVQKLCTILSPLLLENKQVIFEGHLGCEMPCPADLVIVLRTNPQVLQKRMELRGYSSDKIHENILAELLDYCYLTSEQNYSCPIVELDTSKKTAEQSAGEIYQYLIGKRTKLDSVSWKDFLEIETKRPKME